MLRISNNMIEDPGTKQKLSDKLASVDSLIGNVTTLTTNAKTSVVAAINENVSSLASNTSQIADITPYKNLSIKSANFYATSSGGFLSSRANQILDTLVADGFNYITIIPQWYMNLYTDNVIVSTDPKTQSDADTSTLIQNAHAKGLKVILKPHVEVNDGTPRANIAPSNWTTWFNSYNSYMTDMATLAKNNNVEYFVVGTELQSASGSSFRSNWQTIISNVRSIFKNPITYAAIYGSESANVSFWDLVDYIGINMWGGRTAKNPYTVQDIYDSFFNSTTGVNDLLTLKSLSNQYGKNIIFTEIGCSNFGDSLANPSQFTSTQPVNNQVPADFASAMQYIITQNSDWVNGYCWWDIHLSLTDAFTFEGQPAETILSKWNKAYTNVNAPISNMLRTHGFQIFTTENHNNTGNPHSQYVLNTPAYRINQATILNQYTLLMQVRVVGQYNAQDIVFDVLGTTAGNYPVEYGSVYFRVYQYGTMGTTPYIDLIVDGNSALNANNFVAVITQNDTSATVVNLYYIASLTNEYLYYNVKSNVSSPSGHQYMTYYDTQSYSASLPSGTQITPTYPDKHYNSIKIGTGNYDVLNTNTHNSTGDPHTQYAKVSSRVFLPQATSTGYYGKFASITFSSQFAGSVNLFSIAGYASTANPQKGLLWVRCYQGSTLGSVPTIDMKLFNAKGLKPSDFIAVIKQNDASATVIEIYVSLRVLNDTLYLNLIHSEKGNITLLSNQALVNSLPTGTQVLATYDDVVLTSANGTNYKLAVDNTGTLSTSVLS